MNESSAHCLPHIYISRIYSVGRWRANKANTDTHALTLTLSYNCFRSVGWSFCSSFCSLSDALSSFKNTSNSPENATPLKIHTTGVNVSIKRTITPAKYTALMAYSTTKTRSSLMCLIVYHKPTGNVHTNICKSKKNENHVVGWCSDTEAIIGMWIFAYPVSHNE